MKKKAIVLGASGLVGSHLVQQLVNASHVDKIIAITRRAVDFKSPKVHNAVVDFDDLANFKEAFEGDVFFSCLGTTRKQAGSIKAQRKVDFEYQLEAATLAIQQGVEDYFLVSSSGANANSHSPYLKMKGQLEGAISELPFKRISIIQPSLLLGERDQSRVAEGIGSLVLPMLCKLPGLSRFRPIHGFQVAQKMVQLSEQRNTGFLRLTLDEVFPST